MQSDQKFSSSSCITTLVFLVYLSCLASSLDTLKPGDVLNSTSLLVSSRNNFTLGFFTPDGSNNSYVAIWYTDNSSYPIWIGNRDNPVLTNSRPVLKITSAGSLLISRQATGEDPIELYSGHESSRNVSATLLDSGNFVLMSSNGSVGQVIILWQSFDYPTDTLLPGMKLGVNHKTGRNRMLCSWFSPSNPASGAFTMEWDGRRLIVRRRGVMYWTSGKMKDYYVNWDHLKIFENMDFNRYPENLRYNFTCYSSENEEYFMYSLIIDPVSTPSSQNNKSGWRLDDQGDLYNNNGLTIAKVSLCYGYNMEGAESSMGYGGYSWRFYPGCELWEQPKCRSQQQTFVEMSGYFSRSNGDMPLSVYDESSNLSMSDCREHCWNDCKCAGYIGGESGCTYFRGENLMFKDGHYGSAPRLHVLLSQPPLPYKIRRTRRRLMWITFAVVISTGLLVLVAAFFLMRIPKQSLRILTNGAKVAVLFLARGAELFPTFRKEEEETHELLTVERYTDAYGHRNGGAKAQDLRLFTYASITAATNKFSPDYKLGEGGFGPVYKGKTTEGQEIAVKLLSKKSRQGLLEFKTELKLISKLQHVHLVELVGFCTHGEHKMIVYEYMPNKSLDFHLFDPSKKNQLDWDCRIKIIEGTAQGLLYLHKYSRLRIVHRDLKSGNILLDQNMNPKILDFGLARIFKENMNEANTDRRVGTYGYMAPEYAMQGIFSYKSDVYSFGVLILEIVSGRKNNSFHDIEGPLSLVEYTWELWNKDSTSELLDPTLRSSCIIGQVRRCINIGLLCVEDRAVDRPDIEEVISMLRNETSSLPLPKNPAFITRNGVVEELEKSKLEKLPSINELTISEIRER